MMDYSCKFKTYSAFLKQIAEKSYLKNFSQTLEFIGIFQRIDPDSGTAERRKVCSALQFLPEIPCDGPDISSFAAYDPEGDHRKFNTDYVKTWD